MFLFSLKFHRLQRLLLNETMDVSSWNVGHVLKTAWKWSSWSLIWEQDGTNVSFTSDIHVLSSVISFIVLPTVPSPSSAVLLKVLTRWRKTCHSNVWRYLQVSLKRLCLHLNRRTCHGIGLLVHVYKLNCYVPARFTKTPWNNTLLFILEHYYGFQNFHCEQCLFVYFVFCFLSCLIFLFLGTHKSMIHAFMCKLSGLK